MKKLLISSLLMLPLFFSSPANSNAEFVPNQDKLGQMCRMYERKSAKNNAKEIREYKPDRKTRSTPISNQWSATADLGNDFSSPPDQMYTCANPIMPTGSNRSWANVDYLANRSLLLFGSSSYVAVASRDANGTYHKYVQFNAPNWGPLEIGRLYTSSSASTSGHVVNMYNTSSFILERCPAGDVRNTGFVIVERGSSLVANYYTSCTKGATGYSLNGKNDIYIGTIRFNDSSPASSISKKLGLALIETAVKAISQTTYSNYLSQRAWKWFNSYVGAVCSNNCSVVGSGPTQPTPPLN